MTSSQIVCTYLQLIGLVCQFLKISLNLWVCLMKMHPDLTSDLPQLSSFSSWELIIEFDSFEPLPLQNGPVSSTKIWLSYCTMYKREQLL